ncbi:MAG: hypothetical protein MJE63_08720, partial [Proteobacteria bacterium]|nr:hypothetical protein [Pseudomonadota bacterium]
METWEIINQGYLKSQLDQLLESIKNRSELPSGSLSKDHDFDKSNPPAIERLCRLFHLSDFERQLVLFSAGIQLDKTFGDVCCELRGDKSKPWLSFDLALRLFNEGNWAP